jgi:hypothetical protein
MIYSKNGYHEAIAPTGMPETTRRRVTMHSEEFLRDLVPALFLLPLPEKTPMGIKSRISRWPSMESAIFTITVDKRTKGKFWLGLQRRRAISVMFFPVGRPWWLAEYLVAAQHIFQLPKDRGWTFRWVKIDLNGIPMVALIMQTPSLPQNFLNSTRWRLEVSGTTTDIVWNFLKLNEEKGLPLLLSIAPFLFVGALDRPSAEEIG